MAATSDRCRTAARSGRVREHDLPNRARVPSRVDVGFRGAFRVQRPNYLAPTGTDLVGGCQLSGQRACAAA